MNATDELARLQATAERAQAGFLHEEAIALYTEAMEIAPLGDDPVALTQRYEALFRRGQSYEWIGKVQSAKARQIFGDLIGEVRQSDSTILPNILAWKAAAHLSLYEIEEAKFA
jgi:hypothetical protein